MKNKAARKSDYPRDHWLRIRHRPNMAVTFRQRFTYLFVSCAIETRENKDEETGVITRTYHVSNKRKTARTHHDDAKLLPGQAFIDLTRSRRT